MQRFSLWLLLHIREAWRYVARVNSLCTRGCTREMARLLAGDPVCRRLSGRLCSCGAAAWGGRAGPAPHRRQRERAGSASLHAPRAPIRRNAFGIDGGPACRKPGAALPVLWSNLSIGKLSCCVQSQIRLDGGSFLGRSCSEAPSIAGMPLAYMIRSCHF